VQGTGIGSTLRKARLLRGKSIEEASRETLIRAEYLHALERERFEALLGDVYVRGFLRSYSTYLGLDADGILTVYTREFGRAKAALVKPPVAAVLASPSTRSHLPHPHLPHLTRHYLTWPFMIGLAVLLLAMLGAVGLLARSRSVPKSGPGQAGASIPVLPPHVTLDLQATAPVLAIVRIDGGRPQRFQLRTGEGRSFQGTSRIDLELDHGGRVMITVNGHSLGAPGRSRAPFVASYVPQDFRASPSPRPSARPSPSTHPSP
jgi:hypothetical protein